MSKESTGKRITDELRKWLRDGKGSLLAIADRIDSAHEEAIASVMNDALYHANDKDMADLGWYRALDMDKQPVRIGDVMEWCDSGDTLEVVGIGADDTLFYFDKDSDGEEMADWTSARNKRHHHAPTVEDTLHELIGKALMLSEIDGENELVAEYAKRLTLRGDGE